MYLPVGQCLFCEFSPHRVRSKEVKKRSMQKIPLSLGPGLEIGVGV